MRCFSRKPCPLLQLNAGVCVLGGIPRDPSAAMPQRHPIWQPVGDPGAVVEAVARLAMLVESHLDLGALLELALDVQPPPAPLLPPLPPLALAPLAQAAPPRSSQQGAPVANGGGRQRAERERGVGADGKPLPSNRSSVTKRLSGWSSWVLGGGGGGGGGTVGAAAEGRQQRPDRSKGPELAEERPHGSSDGEGTGEPHSAVSAEDSRQEQPESSEPMDIGPPASPAPGNNSGGGGEEAGSVVSGSFAPSALGSPDGGPQQHQQQHASPPPSAFRTPGGHGAGTSVASSTPSTVSFPATPTSPAVLSGGREGSVHGSVSGSGSLSTSASPLPFLSPVPSRPTTGPNPFSRVPPLSLTASGSGGSGSGSFGGGGAAEADVSSIASAAAAAQAPGGPSSHSSLAAAAAGNEASSGRSAAHGDHDQQRQQAAAGPPPRVRIGIARDAAFCYYYRENLSLLMEAGAELVFFSPCSEPLPARLQGVYLGGGVLEFYAHMLSANAPLRAALRAFADAVCGTKSPPMQAPLFSFRMATSREWFYLQWIFPPR